MQIELSGVRKRFGKQEVLKGITLEIARGTRVGLVGPNGSGKSTLLRILMGLLSCEGEVRLDGVSPFRRREQIAARLAYVPQVAPQLGATLGEVINVVSTLRHIDSARVDAGAQRLGLELSTVRKRPFRALSGGMKQKALIALAFASQASLIILDEPTASLDADTRGRFVEMLDEAAAEATVLLCSHRFEEIERFVDRQVELVEGHVVRDAAWVNQARGARVARLGEG